MDWNQAHAQIQASIEVGMALNTQESHHRIVLAVNEHGIRVRIGQDAEILVSWEMLQDCFSALDNGEYNGDIFRAHYPDEAKNHPCHVHVIGMIFVQSRLAYLSENRTYLPIAGIQEV
jgi:hypothetical protein